MEKVSNYNILILSAGRGMELIGAFQRAADDLAVESCIIAGDCAAATPRYGDIIIDSLRTRIVMNVV